MEHSPATTETLANFGIRLRAVLLDYLIYFVSVLTLLPIYNKIAQLVHFPYLSGILAITTVLCFEALQVTFFGRTLGHKIFGLRVIDRAGKNPNFIQAMGRWIVKGVLGITAFFSMMGGGGRTVHDIVTGTRVIYAR